jgi:hypothetical protein
MEQFISIAVNFFCDILLPAALTAKSLHKYKIKIWPRIRTPFFYAAQIYVTLRIKCSLALSISSRFYSWSDKEGVLQLCTRAEALGSIPLGHTFSLR